MTKINIKSLVQDVVKSSHVVSPRVKLSAFVIVTRSLSTVMTSLVWPVGLTSVKVGHIRGRLAIVNNPLLSNILSRRSERSLFFLEDVVNLSLASDRRSKVLFSVILDSDG